MVLAAQARTLAVGVLLSSALWLGGPAWAGPDPARIKAASESFEAGAKAFEAKKYSEAAGHFEAADSAAPSAKALRLAIKARTLAEQAARASTLAALAVVRYPSDPETQAVAEATLGKFSAALHKTKVRCGGPCLLVVGDKIVHGEAATEWTLYVDPGTVTIGTSFVAGGSPKDTSFSATQGGNSELTFNPEVVATPPTKTPTKTPTSTTPETKPGPHVAPDGSATSLEEPEAPEEKGTWRIHPAFFFVGLGATAAVGGATIWSGLDTLESPGEDAVRAGCKGQGETCELYQTGLDSQMRTNVLIGATAGVGALTFVLALVSDWGGDSSDETPPQEAAPVAFELPTPWVDTATPSAGLTLRGKF